MSLISTGDIRDWIGVADGDKTPNEKLAAITKAIQDFVDSVTNRKLEAATYNNDQMYSILDGTGKPWLYLPQYPVSHIDWVGIDADRVWGTGAAISTADIFFYPMSGKVVSEGGYFTRGRRNIKVNYNAGYAPVVGGTHNTAIGTYPLPYDLKQVMVEMSVQAIKEGITAVHTVVGAEFSRFVQLLSGNSFWSNVLAKYTNYAVGLSDREE